jgi:rRNA-processing protein Efg1
MAKNDRHAGGGRASGDKNIKSKGGSFRSSAFGNKYKSWRRGKSNKAKEGNSAGSLKHQLRGHERLLKKILGEQLASPPTGAESARSSGQRDDRIPSLQQKISDVKAQIEAKQQIERERSHAQSSHGRRFLERQKLVRTLRNIRAGSPSGHIDNDQLLRMALDMIYVAHYPHDIVKYRPLFRNGARMVDTGKLLLQRARTRLNILKKIAAPANTTEDDGVLSAPAATFSKEELAAGLATTTSFQRVSWIDSDLYDLLPATWSVEEEIRLFGGADGNRVATSGPIKTGKRPLNERICDASDHNEADQIGDQEESDARFQIGGSGNLGPDATVYVTQSKLLAEAEKLEAELDREEQWQQLPGEHEKKRTSTKLLQMVDQISSSSSSSCSDDSDSDDELDPLTPSSAKIAGVTKSNVDSRNNGDPFLNERNRPSRNSSSDSTGSADSSSSSTVSSGSSTSSDSEDDGVRNDNVSRGSASGFDLTKGSTETIIPIGQLKTGSARDIDKITEKQSDNSRQADELGSDADDFFLEANDGSVAATIDPFGQVSMTRFQEGKSHFKNNNGPKDLDHAFAFKGDKSKGWLTQRQRPGQFNKRRRTDRR